MANEQEKKLLMKGFKATMSKGDDIKIEQDEVDAVIAAVAAGRIVRVRQGIINPSYLISITEDKQRELRYTPGFRHEQRCLGMTPLKDIFQKELPKLAAPSGGGGDGRSPEKLTEKQE